MVIFDLDDTLVETSKCLTPYYLRQAYEAMQQAGLPSEKKSFTKLIQCNQESLTSKEAVQKFCDHLPKNIIEAGLNALSLDIPQSLSLDPVPGALALLEILQEYHTLALVTCGMESIQKQKLKKAGIQPERFSKLVVGNGLSKKVAYQEVMENFKASPNDVLVCGDRISLDLSPAKELGFFTVHFRNGRGKIHFEPQSDVDLTIHSLNELAQLEALYEVT